MTAVLTLTVSVRSADGQEIYWDAETHFIQPVEKEERREWIANCVAEFMESVPVFENEVDIIWCTIIEPQRVLLANHDEKEATRVADLVRLCING